MSTPQLPYRQQQVLQLVADGTSDGDIACQLHVSVSTVKTHLGKLFDRFHAHSRAQLVHHAHLAGHLNPDPQHAEDAAIAREARTLGYRLALVRRGDA